MSRSLEMKKLGREGPSFYSSPFQSLRIFYPLLCCLKGLLFTFTFTRDSIQMVFVQVRGSVTPAPGETWLGEVFPGNVRGINVPSKQRGLEKSPVGGRGLCSPNMPGPGGWLSWCSNCLKEEGAWKGGLWLGWCRWRWGGGAWSELMPLEVRFWVCWETISRDEASLCCSG